MAETSDGGGQRALETRKLAKRQLTVYSDPFEDWSECIQAFQQDLLSKRRQLERQMSRLDMILVAKKPAWLRVQDGGARQAVAMRNYLVCQSVMLDVHQNRLVHYKDKADHLRQAYSSASEEHALSASQIRKQLTTFRRKCKRIVDITDKYCVVYPEDVEGILRSNSPPPADHGAVEVVQQDLSLKPELLAASGHYDSRLKFASRPNIETGQVCHMRRCTFPVANTPSLVGGTSDRRLSCRSANSLPLATPCHTKVDDYDALSVKSQPILFYDVACNFKRERPMSANGDGAKGTKIQDSEHGDPRINELKHRQSRQFVKHIRLATIRSVLSHVTVLLQTAKT